MKRSRVSRMVDKQFRMWNRKKERVVTDTREPAEMPMHSIVAISRQLGSGGEYIAHHVAKKLGFKIYDKKIVEEISNKSQMRKSQVESLDERSKHFIEECYRALMMDSHFLTSSNYFKHLSEVVLTIAQHGKAVIVGRGSHFILGEKTGLRVRIISSDKNRIRRVMKKEKVDKNKAIKLIRKNDVEKGSFIDLHFGQNIDTPENFDLIINTDEITPDEAVDLIVWLEKRKMRETKDHC
ncbi:MAG: cytidylate kinase-like family protein [Candidatus Eremiobacteraeota bacterium]|nr:cytidylate kinase-like family protein [Candidatus Eremiobacteraeota bacterium]